MNLLIWFKDRKELVAEIAWQQRCSRIKDGQIERFKRVQRQLEIDIHNYRDKLTELESEIYSLEEIYAESRDYGDSGE